MSSIKEMHNKKGIVSMKMRIITMSLLTLCLALFTMGGAMAQTQTTGSIEGTITDPQGAAVPNATVTVSGSNLIRPQTTTTDDEGRYRVLNLPPGRYTVLVGATAGFGEASKSDVEVNLSRTSSADVQVQIAGQAASVTITDTSGAAVDVTANTTGTNVSSDQFSNFPTQRTVQSLYTIAPTVTRSGLRDASGRDRDPSVAGSSGPENNYILDGVNTTDPAFGGSGANLPFEFVQEVEIKTGAYGAEYGKSTGGIFNVITKSGGNEFRGDAFAYFTTKGMVREVKNFPFTGSIPTAFSEIDAGFDIGGPIMRDKLWFFGAFNPQRRENFRLTQTFLTPVENTVTTPFYSGKITWSVNQANTVTFSTFGDFTKLEGFQGGSGFGADPLTFSGITETGGHNYTARLNSTITPTWIGEFMFGLHFQRANTLPDAGLLDVPLITNSFAILRDDGTIAPVSQTNVLLPGTTDDDGVFHPNVTGFVDYVLAPGGSLQRNFLTQGYGLFSTQDRNRYEAAARLQNIIGRHTLKYGFEWNRNKYLIDTRSTGPSLTYSDPFDQAAGSNDPTGLTSVNGFRVTNSFGVCTTRGTQIVCPSSANTARIAPAVAAGAIPGFTEAITASITSDEALNNPFLVRTATTLRDFQLVADTYTDVQSFYIQDDYKLSKNVQFNFGLRWDFQQAYGDGDVTYLKLNNFKDNMQPRVGLIWDFTGRGKGKLFINYARFLETPIPLDVNVRAGGGDSQTDKQFRLTRVDAPPDSTLTQAIGNLGAHATPIDPDLKPQTVNEVTGGIEYEAMNDLALGFRGIYRPQGSVIEDGSFDDGDHYFLFNPGESLTDRLAESVIGQRFGRARRYYRALEFTATKRFTNNYQFVASYVYSSLIGNYEGLFRNDNGQSDPNITSLFDLVSLLANSYGRLPNDRPHQFKFNGSYRTPWKLIVSGNFYAQSGNPFSQLIPHPVYGNNEGFGVPRGTAIVPDPTVPNGEGGIENAIGTNRTPFTYNLDLGAYYPIVFSENRQLRFQVDWFNVFNQQRAITLDQTFSINSGVTGVPPVTNPFYGTGLVFQFPSSLRLGVKFQF
ncbi:MAG TPA: TonB-dependent receptor [Pyrinomonadaceae bacterium]|nr:TonB-dependent receptor [Pyrinomonadaceae bacterium]